MYTDSPRYSQNTRKYQHLIYLGKQIVLQSMTSYKITGTHCVKFFDKTDSLPNFRQLVQSIFSKRFTYRFTSYIPAYDILQTLNRHKVEQIVTAAYLKMQNIPDGHTQ